MGFGPNPGIQHEIFFQPNNEMGIEVVVAARDAKDYLYGS